MMVGGGLGGFDFAAVSPRLAMHLGRRKERIVPTSSSLTRSSGTVSTGFASETATRGFFARGAIVRGKRGGEAPRVPTQRPLTEIATLNLSWIWDGPTMGATEECGDSARERERV